MVTEEQIRQALSTVIDPELQRDIVSLGMVRELQMTDASVHLCLALTTLQCPLREQIVEQARERIIALDGGLAVQVELTEMTDAERARAVSLGPKPEQGMASHLNQIRHVVAVMSGKGGVGKSLVTGLLAVELRRRGLRVGILDADITGPSIPRMFGLSEHPQSTPLGIAPVSTRSGIRAISINLLLSREDEAIIWRGPLIGGAIKQFWGDVLWATLDYLLIDLPPGTADAPLTVMQSVPLNGVILVTSPQELAGMVVRKAANMAAQMGVPILGVVENMSYAVCPRCGERHEVFGASHAAEVARAIGVPTLGRLPLDPRISALSDRGQIEDYASPEFAQLVDRLLTLVPETATTPRL